MLAELDELLLSEARVAGWDSNLPPSRSHWHQPAICLASSTIDYRSASRNLSTTENRCPRPGGQVSAPTSPRHTAELGHPATA